jgi:peroxiredoxin
VLAVVAVLIVAFGPTTTEISMVAWIGTLTVAEGIGLIFGILVVILLAAETMFLIEMLKQIGKLTLRLEAVESGVSTTSEAQSDWVGLPQDEDAPAFELPDLNGEMVSLESLIAEGTPLMLIFSSPTCGPCQEMAPEIGQWIRDYSDIMKFVVISQGSAELNRAKATEYGITPLLLQKEHEVADLFLVRGTPSAVILRIDGSIYSPLAEGPDAIRELVVEETKPPIYEQSVEMPKVNVLGQPNETPFAVIGGPAPDVTLPDVNGNEIKLSQFLGNPTLMVFWNTGCSYCEAMLRDLKAWENKPPKGAPQLLFITAGPASDIRKQGFRSPVMLESTFAIAQLFKVQGTPSAVLIDENGFVTSDPAVGSDAVMQLANSTARKYAKGNPKPAAV